MNRLRITKWEGRSLRFPADVDPQDNIVVKAILKLAEAFGRTLGEEETMRVHLEKRIPVQAGLGGGSSDAAAAAETRSIAWWIAAWLAWTSSR